MWQSLPTLRAWYLHKLSLSHQVMRCSTFSGAVRPVAVPLHRHRAALLPRPQSPRSAPSAVHAAHQWRWAGRGERQTGSRVITARMSQGLPELVLTLISPTSGPPGRRRREPVHLAGLQEEGPTARAVHVAPWQCLPAAAGGLLPGAAGGGEGHQRLCAHLLQEHWWVPQEWGADAMRKFLPVPWSDCTTQRQISTWIIILHNIASTLVQKQKKLFIA